MKIKSNQAKENGNIYYNTGDSKHAKEMIPSDSKTLSSIYNKRFQMCML